MCELVLKYACGTFRHEFSILSRIFKVTGIFSYKIGRSNCARNDKVGGNNSNIYLLLESSDRNICWLEIVIC